MFIPLLLITVVLVAAPQNPLCQIGGLGQLIDGRTGHDNVEVDAGAFGKGNKLPRDNRLNHQTSILPFLEVYVTLHSIALNFISLYHRSQIISVLSYSFMQLRYITCRISICQQGTSGSVGKTRRMLRVSSLWNSLSSSKEFATFHESMSLLTTTTTNTSR